MQIKKIFEIGVGEAYTCRTKRFWGSDIECHLFEPNPILYKDLIDQTKEYKNVYVYNIAITDKSGEEEISLMGNCSYINGIISPVILHQGFDSDAIKNASKINIKSETIDKFDKGDIDVLLIDTEGCEWFVLEKLISRPNQIVIETSTIAADGLPTPNKNINKILFWMWKNNYQLALKDENDSHFMKMKT
ncbi:MAG: FkbM family methyltransferase [Caulobacteraceae bacterium]|nr:FkbM family methyltransferase [Caulobacteraceae bacterium]